MDDVPTDDDNYATSVWGVEQGLPQNSIKSILQSHDGYLWLATFNGLARFDGVKFTTFDTSNTRGLRNNLINRIFEDSRGWLWLGHDSGDVTVYDHGEMRQLAVPADWLCRPIDSFAEDAAGGIWILDRRGWILPVNGLTAGNILKSQASGDCLIRDEKGCIWIRVHAPDGGCSFQTINTANPETTPPLAGNSLAFASRRGGLWVAEKDRLHRWQNGQWQEERPPFPALDMYFDTLLETQDGRLLAGSFTQGIYIQETNRITKHLTTKNGLANDWVSCLAEDSEGNIWVGTGGGLNQLQTRRVQMLNSPDNWQGKAVLSVSPGWEGGLWLATEGAGIYRWQDGVVHSLPLNTSQPSRVFWSILQTTNSSVWLGSWGSGLLLFSNNTVVTAPVTPGVSDEIICLYTDRQGRLWVGSTAGLGCFTGNQWMPLDTGSDQPRPDVRCLVETTGGDIWFGTMGAGLYCWRAGRLTHFTTQAGLASDYISALWEDPNKSLWVGTLGGGMSRFQNGVFTSVTKKQGLPSDVICNIQTDAPGNLWMSSYAGIFRVRYEELNACADGKSSAVNSLLYDHSDGLRSIEMVGGCQPSSCRMSDGRLCFATRAGLAIVNPARAFVNQRPPPVVIEDFLVNGKPHPIPENTNWANPFNVMLSPAEQRILINYTGLSFTAPQRVRFRYKLDGLDQDWVEAGAKRSADYSYLPPGRYAFHVIACNGDGIWNATGAALAFTLPPHYWQTWWFSASCWLAGGGLAGGILLAMVRQRNRRKLAILERQRSLERERSRISQDIHDELGSSLTRITMLSQSAQGKSKTGRSPEQDLDKIFSIARNITRSMDEIVWAINPKHDTLGSLMAYLSNFAEEFLGSAGISFEVDFPAVRIKLSVAAQVRHDVFLAFKEALNNIVKHSGATQVSIALAVCEREFTLIVDDNGCGFDPSARDRSPARAARRARGNGLENMQKRLRAIGGTCQIEKSPQGGVRVHFHVPLNAKSVQARNAR